MAMYNGNRQQSFSFPMLSSEEILLCMNELQISLEKADLEKPSARSVKPVYEALCEACIGVTKEEINCVLEDESCTNLEFPELHEDSLPNLAYFRAVSRLMSAAGVHDTRLWDIVKPDPKRFKRNMSAVINFAKFREERLQNFTELSNKTEELLDLRAQAEEENSKIEDQIREIQEEREREIPQIERLEKECKELEAEINASNKEQALLKYQANNLKQTGNELRDQLANLQFQRLNTVQETEKIQSKIVQSPVRLKRELNEQRRQLEAQKEENADIQSRLEELHVKMKALTTAEQDCHAALSLIEEVQDNMLKCKAAAKEKKGMATSIKQHDKLIKQFEVNKTELSRQVKIMQDRVTRLEKQSYLKVQAAENEKATVAQELEELQAANAQNLTEAKENKEKRKGIEKKIEQQRQQRNKILQERTNSCLELEDTVKQSSQTLLAAIQSTGL